MIFDETFDVMKTHLNNRWRINTLNACKEINIDLTEIKQQTITQLQSTVFTYDEWIDLMQNEIMMPSMDK